MALTKCYKESKNAVEREEDYIDNFILNLNEKFWKALKCIFALATVKRFDFSDLAAFRSKFVLSIVDFHLCKAAVQ